MDLVAGVVHVVESQHELVDRRIVTGPPKTEAGRRTVRIPPHLLPVLSEHLNNWVGSEPGALVFTGDKGGWLRRSQWNSRWREARQKVGLPELHFHDLRHSGNTLAAATGASTKELMSRLGHASAQAALRYQHATRERDQAIADGLSDMVSEAIGQPRTTPDADECAMGAF
jgi:integrase